MKQRSESAHHLIAPPGVTFRSLKRVYSHPVALNQCRIFLRKHKRLEALSYYDTAGSVEMIMNDRPPGAAAIASETAAKIYGGNILKRNVEDNAQNFTRFFLLAKADSRQEKARSESGTWKTSLVFAVKNSPGMLFRAMLVLRCEISILLKLNPGLTGKSRGNICFTSISWAEAMTRPSSALFPNWKRFPASLGFWAATVRNGLALHLYESATLHYSVADLSSRVDWSIKPAACSRTTGFSA